MAEEAREEIDLDALLTLEQQFQVMRYAEARDTAGLRAYLRALGPQLLAQGILPDYLYYLLCWRWKLFVVR